MPSSTFLNLPNEKRERILKKCYEEFTKHTYQVASVSRIVEELGISKGSIYKYFTNKKDLYLYLINEAATIKMNYLSANLEIESDEFFDVLWSVIKTGVEFDMTYTEYSLFLGKVASDSEAIADMPINQMLLDKSHNFIKNIVLNAQDHGKVRDDVDVDLIAYFINTIITNYANMVARKFNLSVEELFTESKHKAKSCNFNKEYALNELRTLLDMIKVGIKK